MNKLAIGITTFNNSSNIENIKKIYNTQEVDVFVVDDYSTDNTQELLAANNIKYSVPPRKIGAPGYARNMIIDAAYQNGNQFITFIDGDDDVLIENLVTVATSVDAKYDMYCTPLLVLGYNNALVPMVTSWAEYTGEMSTEDLKLEENYQLKFRLLLRSGGRIYKLQTMIDNAIKYDPDKSGQDGLFNHAFFDVADKVFFHDETKPFYLYDIQMGSLSNNYKVDELAGRLKIVEEIAKFPFAINTKQSSAEKTLVRYTDTFRMEESEKIKVRDMLNEFAETNLVYIPTKDYLRVNDDVLEFKSGLNIILINTDVEIEVAVNFNIIKIESFKEFESIREQLIYNKTVVFDQSFTRINSQFLKSIIDNNDDVVQPYLQTNNNVNAHLFRTNKYHGFSLDGFSSTYSFVGMIFKTKYFFTYDFNYSSSYEYLIKVLFLNMLIPTVHYVEDFYVKPRIFTSSYRLNVINLYNKCYFANTKAKINVYSRLAKNPIKTGAFYGVTPSYQSDNISYEDLSFVETELQEFKGFDGAYFVNEEGNIIETTSSSSELNFNKMILGKKVENGITSIASKTLINIPVNYQVENEKSIKLKDYTLTFDKIKTGSISTSYLQFNEDMLGFGVNKELIQLLDKNGTKHSVDEEIIPAGKYQVILLDIIKGDPEYLNNVQFRIAAEQTSN